MKQSQATYSPKALEIVEASQELIQTRGYDGFSYRDVAERVGIRSASVHYHFASKPELALAVTQRYRAEFSDMVTALATRGLDPLGQLRGFAALFEATLADSDRMCLCGMLASEAESLPDEVLAEVREFFVEQESWLAAVLSDGVDSGLIDGEHDPTSFAKVYLSALEGAMTMARSKGSSAYLREVAEQLLSTVERRAPMP